MSSFVANKLVKMLINAGKKIKDSKILILGFTFKENCPDVRNTKIADVYDELIDFGLNVDIYDYEASKIEVKEEYNINLIDKVVEQYDGILLAVKHKKFKSINLEKIKKDKKSVIFDLKGFFPKDKVNSRL